MFQPDMDLAFLMSMFVGALQMTEFLYACLSWLRVQVRQDDESIRTFEVTSSSMLVNNVQEALRNFTQRSHIVSFLPPKYTFPGVEQLFLCMMCICFPCVQALRCVSAQFVIQIRV